MEPKQRSVLREYTKQFLTVGELEVEYLCFGEGKELLLTFHGFGRKAEDFLFFEKVWGERYTIVSINLFFHENSVFPIKRIVSDPLRQEELEEIADTFLMLFKRERLSLAGYSLGGKLALLLCELMPQKVDALWLFAPDGIKINLWYLIASSTYPGRKTYAYFLSHPELFFKTVEYSHKIGLVSNKIKKFALNNMDSYSKRKLVRDVWLTYRLCNPNMKVLSAFIREFNIPVFQFFGERDNIIRPSFGIAFAKKIKQEKNLHVLPLGHKLFMSPCDVEVKKVMERLK